MSKTIKLSSPGRICLFGEHQDYLGLNVIPAAINLRCYIDGKTTNSGEIILDDLGYKKIIKVPLGLISHSKPLYLEKNDYFKAIINVFLKKGLLNDLNPKIGFSGTLRNDVPQKSGLSSSAAILVAFTKLLSEILGLGLDKKDIGHYAYLAEHDELGIPCGQMDQLASSIGNSFLMKCTIPPKITPIKKNLEGIIAVDTLIPKSTNSVHSIRVREINEAIAFLKAEMNFNIYKTKFDEVEDILIKKNQIWLKRIRATLKNRDITKDAYIELKKDEPDFSNLGHLLLEHQKFLRDDYEVSVKKIDFLIEKAMEAGALGGKLTGAGMGGSIVVFAPGKEKEVAKIMDSSGGKSYIVKLDEGVRIEA